MAFTKITCSRSACRRYSKQVHTVVPTASPIDLRERGQCPSTKSPSITTAWTAKTRSKAAMSSYQDCENGPPEDNTCCAQGLRHSSAFCDDALRHAPCLFPGHARVCRLGAFKRDSPHNMKGRRVKRGHLSTGGFPYDALEVR